MPEAMIFALSRTLRATSAAAAPETGVDRLPYVPRPNGVWSVSPCTTSMSSGGMPELLGDDLRERRLVALPLGLNRKPHNGFAGRMDPQLAAVGHAEAEDVHVLARPGADGLGEERHADAHQLAARALLLLLCAQRVVADHVHGHAHGGLVVARVVHPAGLGLCTGTGRV